MRARDLSLALLLLFVGITISSNAIPEGYLEFPEPLLGLELQSDKIRITVCQCGGTQKDSFRFDVQTNNKKQLLTILRVKADACKMMPQRENYEYTLTETGLDSKIPVFITNPLLGDEFLADMTQHALEDKAGKTDETGATETLRNKAESVFKQIYTGSHY